ncbi:MAG: hypothetical protein ACLU0O_08550 [Collinsella sp.]
MREHNLTPAGPSREIALIDDIISDDPTTYVTQITVPLLCSIKNLRTGMQCSSTNERQLRRTAMSRTIPDMAVLPRNRKRTDELCRREGLDGERTKAARSRVMIKSTPARSAIARIQPSSKSGSSE